eukprot:gnl/TRDRNA2_/TRDRNA2_36201_c0_seq1.p1 gnl/TRDRNA2_/TRDRNA2_36201_c0~~gnl/TRDRNA2_/TRDRNA2_36201_c0_seq1.p1  ORF type:complete len:143 (+),score=27.54 gnl/TRDRNA2_/TRDRNA2_36201_c0_seq1:37-465(+)
MKHCCGWYAAALLLAFIADHVAASSLRHTAAVSLESDKGNTTRTCMDIHDECKQRKAALCRGCGFPLYYGSCKEAIMDQCGWNFLQMSHNASVEGTGAYMDRCDACAEGYTTPKRVCKKECHEYEILQAYADKPPCSGSCPS